MLSGTITLLKSEPKNTVAMTGYPSISLGISTIFDFPMYFVIFR